MMKYHVITKCMDTTIPSNSVLIQHSERFNQQLYYNSVLFWFVVEDKEQILLYKMTDPLLAHSVYIYSFRCLILLICEYVYKYNTLFVQLLIYFFIENCNETLNRCTPLTITNCYCKGHMSLRVFVSTTSYPFIK